MIIEGIMKLLLTFTLFSVLGISCADESQFSSGTKSIKGELNSDDVIEAKRFEFTVDSIEQQPVDYLFIVDNSTSMAKIIDQMQKGFLDIANKGEFPEGAKIGVITTSVDESYKENSKIVGFKSLVTRESIKRNPDRLADHGKGCINGWFSPNEKDGKGNYCLNVATDFKLYGTGYEAGLSAFDNFLSAQKNNSPFREGALLNVVFFSDTHDVGAKHDGLKARRDAYTVDGFFKKAKAISGIKSIKFHGLIPQKGNKSACSTEGTYEFAYSKFIEETGGHQVHCKGSNYAKFISKMVVESRKSSSEEFELPADFSGSVIGATIDGEPAEYSYDEDNNKVTIKNLTKTEMAQKVVVLFE